VSQKKRFLNAEVTTANGSYRRILKDGNDIGVVTMASQMGYTYITVSLTTDEPFGYYLSLSHSD
jgi:hypothetical protein